MRKDTIKERITRLEEQISEIKENHLPHLQAGIDKVDSRTWWILSTVILGFLVSIALTLWK